MILASSLSNTTSNLDTVRLLLDRGANPFEKTPGGNDGLENCPTNGCKQIIAEAIWKRLYARDRDTARRYSRQSQVPKDVWEIILLNKRQQQLCQNLSSDKNKEVLKLFVIEFNIPITEGMTKGQLCGIISRYLVYGRIASEEPIKKIRKEEMQIRSIAQNYGLDPTESIETLLLKLSQMVK